MVYESLGSHAADWAGKTAPEVGEVGDEDGSILIVPVGSIEQHGNHLPVSTDTILVDAVAHAGAEATDAPILVTPPIWSGFSPHHMGFGGTITLDDDTFVDVMADVADAALENGFDALMLLNGHGGNISFVGAATSVIGNAHPDVEVLGLTYFQLAAEFIDEIRESASGGMAHGGEFETSLVMHLRPDLVHEDLVEGTYMEDPYGDLRGEDLMEGGPLGVYRTFEEYTATGAIGDPNLATPGKGEEIYDRLAESLGGLLDDVHAENS